jgi:hypothetical protein
MPEQTQNYTSSNHIPLSAAKKSKAPPIVSLIFCKCRKVHINSVLTTLFSPSAPPVLPSVPKCAKISIDENYIFAFKVTISAFSFKLSTHKLKNTFCNK